MAAVVLDGKVLAKEIQISLKAKVEQLTPKLSRPPGLAVVLVGENPASQVYVKSKSKNAIECGIKVKDLKLSAEISNEQLQNELKQLSLDPEVDGILLQLPLPKGLDEFQALLAIAPEKDVDGLHPMNQGLLVRGADCPRPCTPFGVMKLIDLACEKLQRSKDLSGLKAVVVGR